MNTATASFNIKSIPNIVQTDISTLISKILTILVLLGGIIALFYLIFGGIKYVTSGGNPKETEAARNQITAAIIGLIIIFFSFTAIQIIGSIIGIKLLEVPF